MRKLVEKRKQLETMISIFEIQTSNGRLFVFEQPAESRAWSNSSVVKTAKNPDVIMVRSDMCMFELSVRGSRAGNKSAQINLRSS